ncbi:hypothetical protein ACFQJ5_01810 [Halomicroarcula sp. GCM10025324]|uniref:hypothetical protein n=1 Tax=Haloarcula TaxID=2237 RepID=UPI0023E7F0DA|nr:hypothetical protein [Halomicroarcula sp. ZS-22-S1]
MIDGEVVQLDGVERFASATVPGRRLVEAVFRPESAVRLYSEFAGGVSCGSRPCTCAPYWANPTRR